MRILLALVVLVVVAVLVYFLISGATGIVNAARRRSQRREEERARWRMNVENHDGQVRVEIEKLGQGRIPIAELDPARDDFSDLLFAAEALAEERAAELNVVTPRTLDS